MKITPNQVRKSPKTTSTDHKMPRPPPGVYQPLFLVGWFSTDIFIAIASDYEFFTESNFSPVVPNRPKNRPWTEFDYFSVPGWTYYAI